MAGPGTTRRWRRPTRPARILGELGPATWSLAELIEAAARCGQPGQAAAALDRLSEATSAAGTDWALGIQARCRALLERGARRPSTCTAGDRAAGPHPGAGGAGPRLPAVRRVAAPRTAAGGGAGPAPRRLPDAGRDGARGVRGTRSASSCWPPARRSEAQHGDGRRADPAGGQDRQARRGAGTPIRRSARSCSSARARSSGTCARCSRSSASARGRNSPWRCPTSRRPSRRPSRAASAAGDLAAVDVQELAGDVRRVLQEQDAVNHVADLPHAPERGKLAAEPLVAFRRVHRGLDDARRDGVDPDAARGVLHGQ